MRSGELMETFEKPLPVPSTYSNLSDKARERHRPENKAAVRRDWEAGTFRRLVTRFERLWVHLIQLN